MPRGSCIALVAAAIAAAAVPAALRGEDAVPESPARLLERAFDNLYGDDFVQVLSLSTRRRESRAMVRRIQLMRKQRVRPGKALVRFLEPPEVRRTSVLIVEAAGRDDDLFVFLPALGKVRRIAASQRADAFFGTDLSYEDVEPKRAADWDATLVQASEEEGTPCLLLELRPVNERVSTYERMVSCIEPRHALILHTQFWRGGQVVKELRVRPADVREVAGRWIPFALRMETPSARSETLATTESYDILPGLSEAVFTTSNLETGDADGDRRTAGGS